MRRILMASLLATGALTVSSCATISENECVAGGWEDLGFRDGEKGRSQSRLTDYNKTCNKFSVTPDRTAYLRGYDQGVQRYCDYDRGFSRGADGNTIQTVCQSFPDSDYFVGYDQGLNNFCSFDTGYEHGVKAKSEAELCRTVPNDGYFAGYEEGRITHALYSERDEMLDRYQHKDDALSEARDHMNKENISEKEYKRLRKKVWKLEEELEEMKINIRVFERLNKLTEADL